MNTVTSLKMLIVSKRARHAVWENQRTLQAKEALIAGELEMIVVAMPHMCHLSMITK